MPDLPFVVLLGGTVVALSVVSILQYGRSLKRHQGLQDVADRQQGRAEALLDRQEALLTRAEELVQQLESRDRP